ncbi:hypothetical protein ACELLULO517_18225 [Acidisoma cellulosilytica]|uniref:Uncharacterized protein n=1 Tax=Acidisoma cellulosilyticum TaxID=2802395 RepID=A0A963Z400_9PROT|nr:hypothetical protein [Acidisoma cellulosilyticum]MCB8882189.1 hypothetical protein [Acidisoma cellulosilyticum]
MGNYSSVEFKPNRHGMTSFVPEELSRYVDHCRFQTRIEKLIFAVGKCNARLDKNPDLFQFYHLMSRRDAIIATGSRVPSLDLLELLVHEADGPGVRIPQPIFRLAKQNGDIVLRANRPESAEDFLILLETMRLADGDATTMSGRENSHQTNKRSANRLSTTFDQIGLHVSAQIAEHVQSLAEFVNSGGQISMLLRLAIAIARICTIFPCSIGGYTIGRSLTTMMLRWEGLAPLFVSRAFAKHAASLEEALQSGQMNGDWDLWCFTFLDIIEDSLLETWTCFDGLERLSSEWIEALKAAGVHAHSSAFSIVRSLAFDPVVSANSVAKRLDVSPQAANKVVGNLAAIGILRLYGEAGRNRSFFAPSVLAILSEGEA